MAFGKSGSGGPFDPSIYSFGKSKDETVRTISDKSRRIGSNDVSRRGKNLDDPSVGRSFIDAQSLQIVGDRNDPQIQSPEVFAARAPLVDSLAADNCGGGRNEVS